MGVRLFERSHHKVVLTPAGKVFYENVQNILRQTNKAVALARKVDKGEAGTIRIGFVSTAAITVLPEALKMLQTDVPSAEIELKDLPPAEQIDALYREQLDIGFLRAKLAEDVLSTWVVSAERLIVAVPESCELAAKPSIDVKDLVPWTGSVGSVDSHYA
jgi:DNA-binding transcriptional LysR family regulator